MLHTVGRYPLILQRRAEIGTIAQVGELVCTKDDTHLCMMLSTYTDVAIRPGEI